MRRRILRTLSRRPGTRTDPDPGVRPLPPSDFVGKSLFATTKTVSLHHGPEGDLADSLQPCYAIRPMRSEVAHETDGPGGQHLRGLLVRPSCPGGAALITHSKAAVTLFADKVGRQWVARDPDGKFWVLP